MTRDSFNTHRIALALLLSSALFVAACSTTGSGATNASATGALPPTLDGKAPLVIAHRGASGYIPEETLEAYTMAIEQGADYIEMDLVSTKDGVLVARHDPNLAISTDVATRPEFASRKKTKQVDGETQVGWFVDDFTLAELKTLGAISTDPERPQNFNGKYKVPTFQEIIDLAKLKSKETGRTIGIYPEAKNASYFRQLGLPLEDNLLAALTNAGWNSASAPVFVQSFEPGSLKYPRSKGLKTKVVQLIDADDVDLKTGKLVFAVPNDRPYEWTLHGDRRNFDVMTTPQGLAEIKIYADGIGPWKRFIINLKGQVDASGKVIDQNRDGKLSDADGLAMPPSSLVQDAHKAGLFVHIYTMRNEQRRLAMDYKNDPVKEYLAFYRLGVDGVFTDFTDTALSARSVYMRSLNP